MPSLRDTSTNDCRRHFAGHVAIFIGTGEKQRTPGCVSRELADPASRASISNFLLFNRNDGRHLGYGEAEQLGDTYAEVHFWALSQGKAIGAEFEALKYIAAADRDDVVVTPKVTVRKGWDGRWLNLMVAWLITTAMLFRFNRKQVRHMYPLRARSIG
jgi:hypothetical protein